MTSGTWSAVNPLVTSTPPGAIRENRQDENRRNRNAVRLATTTCAGGVGSSTPQIGHPTTDEVRETVACDVVARGVDRVRVVVEREHLGGAQQRGGDGQHARSRAGVDHAARR